MFWNMKFIYDKNIDLFVCIGFPEEILCVLCTSTNKTTQQASVVGSVLEAICDYLANS